MTTQLIKQYYALRVQTTGATPGDTTYTDFDYDGIDLSFDGTDVTVTSGSETATFAFADVTEPVFATGYALIAEIGAWSTGVDRTSPSQEAGVSVLTTGDYSIETDDYVVGVASGTTTVTLPGFEVANRRIVIFDAGQGFTANPVTVDAGDLLIDGAATLALDTDGQRVELMGLAGEDFSMWTVLSNTATGGGGSLPAGTTSGSILKYNGAAWVEDTTFNSQATTLQILKSSSLNMHILGGANDNYLLIQTTGTTEHVQSSGADVYNRQIDSHGYTLTATDGTNLSTHVASNEEASSILTDSTVTRTIATISNYATGFTAASTDNADGTYLTELDATPAGTAQMLTTLTGAAANVDYEARVQATPSDAGVHLIWQRTDNNTVSDDQAYLDLSGGGNMVSLYSRRHSVSTDPIEQEFTMTVYNDGSSSSFDITGEVDETFRARIYAEKGYLSLAAYQVGGANPGDALFVANTDGGVNVNSSATDCSPVSISVNGAQHQTGVVNSVALGMNGAQVAHSGTVYTGGRVLNHTAVADDYAIDSYDHVIEFSGAAGKTLTLPAGVLGRNFIVCNTDAVNTVDVATTGGELIAAGASPYAVSPNSNYSFVFVSTGWIII